MALWLCKAVEAAQQKRLPACSLACGTEQFCTRVDALLRQHLIAQIGPGQVLEAVLRRLCGGLTLVWSIITKLLTARQERRWQRGT